MEFTADKRERSLSSWVQSVPFPWGMVCFSLLYLIKLLLSVSLTSQHPFSVIYSIGLLLVFSVVAYEKPQEMLLTLLCMVYLWGVSGTAHRFTAWLPLPLMCLVILCFIHWKAIIRHLTQHQLQSGNSFLVPVALLAIVLPLIGIAVGLARGNEPYFILKDADGWIFYLLYIPLGWILTDNQWRRRFSQLILANGIMVAGIILVSLLLLETDIVDTAQLNFWFYNQLKVGGHIEPTHLFFHRLYTGNSLILLLSLSVLFNSMMKRKMSLVWGSIMLATLMSAVIVNFSRGYFLVNLYLLIALTVLNSAASASRRIAWFKTISAGMVILTFTILILIMGGYGNAFLGKLVVKNKEPPKLENNLPLRGTWNKRRISSITIKLFQYQALFQAWKQRPFLGYGFGAMLKNGQTYRLKDAEPHIFEAGYGDLLMKTGLLGILFWGGSILYLLGNRESGVSIKTDDPLAVPLLVLLPGLILLYGTNPFLYSPFGILPIVYLAAAVYGRSFKQAVA